MREAMGGNVLGLPTKDVTAADTAGSFQDPDQGIANDPDDHSGGGVCSIAQIQKVDRRKSAAKTLNRNDWWLLQGVLTRARDTGFSR